MNAFDLRKYWAYKYQSTFNEFYKSKSYALDIVFLKRLLDKYGEFVILEAIDIFFAKESKKVASLNFFTSAKVFESKFKDIIKLSRVIKHKRFLLSFPKELQEKARPLLNEYQDYCNWETIAEHEKTRKVEIEKMLEELTSVYFSKGN